MVAIFTGNGLGQFNASVQAGSTRLGQSRDTYSVNAATGNLVLQGFDESLLVRGLGAAAVRTYNSRGQLSDSGQDGWVTGYEHRVVLNGTLGAAGSSVTRILSDGQRSTFTFSGGDDEGYYTYTSTDGEGAHDTLTWSPYDDNWVFTEGSTLRFEYYAGDRLIGFGDRSGAGFYSVMYDALGRISEVRAADGVANGDAILYAYNGATQQLASISTRENGVLKQQVTYGYDTFGRLAWVQTDLTPGNTEDNEWGTYAGLNDHHLFRTSYEYVTANASDLRIARVTGSDGVTAAYTYEADGTGGFRVKTVTQGSASDGSARTLTFVYRANETDVVDGAGRTWTYQYDVNKRLTAMLEPAVNGMRARTAYEYDAAGNITRITGNAVTGTTAGSALVDTVFRYDANGNRTLQRDRLGNTIAWTYSANNQVLTETRYSIADADGLDPTHVGTTNLPSGALTTQYVYDGSDRLRFVVNANGEVRELTYATSGNSYGNLASERRYLNATYAGAYTEAALSSWTTLASGNPRDPSVVRRAASLTTYIYDAKGRLQQTIEYANVNADAAGTGVLDAGATITRYTHDAQGQLLQKIVSRGASRTDSSVLAGSEITEYVYDGMGRLLSVLSRDAGSAANDDALTVQSTYLYDDSSNSIRVTLDSGLVRFEQRNSAGDTRAVWEGGAANGNGFHIRGVINTYDTTGRLRMTQDPAGGRTYFFYDDSGRITETVDPTGAMVRTIYDALGRKSYTVVYENRVDTSTWLVDDVVVKTQFDYNDEGPTASNHAWVQWSDYDRGTSYSYDNAGRLATMTTADGLKTTYLYDGASRLVATTQGASGWSAGDAQWRTTRLFYDNADRLVATLDAEGYLNESVYDAGGRLIKTIRYAAATNSANRASGTLAQLRPITAGDDQSTRYFYDARSRQIGMLDAEGYLTESLYDEANHQRAVKEYAKRLTRLTGNEALSTLRTAATTSAPTEAFRLTQHSYNGLGQLTTSLNHEGTVTRYTYDEAARLVRTEVAQGTTEVRQGNRRYDAFGNLIGEISGENAVYLLAGMTEEQLDAVYANYGVRHSYDLLGRRIESTDALGNKTWYFYDANSRQTYVVRGVEDSANIRNAQGEVSETRYNAFGEVFNTIAYTGRITIAVPGDRASVQAAISTLQYVAAQDSSRSFSYDGMGRLEYKSETDGQSIGYGYTLFGELSAVSRAYRDAQNRTLFAYTEYAYDRRGLRLSQTDAARSPTGTVTVTRTVTNAYDAFGRVTRQTDARGTVRELAYDRLGRQVSSITRGVSGQDLVQTSSYDAFDRMLTQTDATGRTTSYAYSDSARSVTVTSPEGISITTLQNRFGQTVEVRQPQPGGTTAVTTSVYDRNGNLTQRTDPLGNSASNAYDVRGLLTLSEDASGRRIQYSYDAAGRTLTRTEDPHRSKGDGPRLELVTQYVFDGQGRTVQVTDPSGRVSAMRYDRKGNLTELALDPNGLNLRTTYTWDYNGRQLSVTEGAGTAAARQTVYAYDGFGRRISETVGTGSAQVVTTYEYDANDNLVRKSGAGGTVLFAYDAANRLRFTVDATGGLTEQHYDRAGRMTAQRTYAKAVDLSSLGTAIPTEAQLSGLIVSQSLLDTFSDKTLYQVYDGDGRVRLSINGYEMVEWNYDSAGRRISEKRYAFAQSGLVLFERNALIAGTASVASLQSRIRADAQSDSVMRYFYDANDRLVYTVDGNGGMTRMWYDKAGRVVSTRQFAKPAALATLGTATIASLDAQIDLAAGYEGESRVYDGAGRLRFVLSADGVLREMRYDEAGNAVSSLRYFASASALQTALGAALSAGTVDHRYDFQAFVDENEATAASSHSIYDAAGRQRLSITRTSATQASVVEQQYDTAGRMVGTYAYTALLDVNATLSYDLSQGTATEASLSTWLNANRSTAQVQRMVYDAAGRVAYSIDGVGAVTSTRYNALGMVASVRQHAQAVALNLNGTTLDAATVASALVETAQDRVDYNVYDASARVVFRVHADASVEEIRYDGVGRVRTTLAYAARLDATTMAQVSAGTASQASFAAHVSANEANARAEGLFYNQAGRVNYQVMRSGSGSGQVTLTRYDGIGREIEKTRYGFDIPYALDATLLDISRATNAGFSTDPSVRATQTRTMRYFYDAGNRQRFMLDASGALSEQRFDAIGRVTQTIVYGKRPTSTTDITALTTWAATQPASDYRTSSMTYDLAGQVTTRTDALGQVESFEYDAAGNITRHTDRAGAVWNYEYDRASRRTAEISPAVAVSTSTGTVVTRPIVTRMEYDGVKNMLRRIENADTSETRITRYEYDNRGHTVRIVLPDPVTGLDPATGSADTIEILYDTLGQAVLEKDALGNRSYKVYDNLGRVIYDIDQELQVTSHIYNAFGEETRSVRHAQALYTGGVPSYAGPGSGDWMPDQAQSQLVIEKRLTRDSTRDRGVDSSYNLLGQKVQVQQDAVSYVKSDGTAATGRPTLRTQFNAYGEAAVTLILLEGTPDQRGAVWARTYRYYDALGRETVSIDAEGYVSSQTWNAYGEIQTKIEHARRLSAATLTRSDLTLPPTSPDQGDAITGFDRRVDFTYDALGRVTVQTVRQFVQTSSASAGAWTDVATQFGYDAEGRTTSIVDGSGTTTTRYDALGRTLSVQQPSRAVVTAQADSQLQVSIFNRLTSAVLYEQRSPYTELSYDAFGNAVRVQRYADGKIGTSAAIASSNDQITETNYDRRGRIVEERDLAAGTVTYRTYDAGDRVLSMQTQSTTRLYLNNSYNVYSGYSYDKVGRQLSVATGGSQFVVDASEIVRYNAFGEITAKDDRIADAFAFDTPYITYEYDSAGRMLRTNAQGGVWRDSAYDLAGRMVRTTQASVTVNAQGVEQVVNAITDIRYDKLGRAIRQELPSNSDDLNQRPVIVREYDRWGNVVRNVDARGYETQIRYNSQNKAVMEIRPEVKVVNADGTEVRARPTLTWYYDSYGRLTESRDANGNSQRMVYDSVGRLVESVDALGKVTRMAYDLFDRDRYTQNPIGYITWKAYDRAGRVMSHGDFVGHKDDATKRQIKTLETYGLQGSTDRWSVTNALGHTARYNYDSRHLLTSSYSAAGVAKHYAYNLQGMKSRESNGAYNHHRYLLSQKDVNGTITGFTGIGQGGVPTPYSGPAIIKDRESEYVFVDEQTWDYDLFGRLVDHNDLGGADYDYTYHAQTGQLIKTSRSAVSTQINVVLKYGYAGNLPDVIPPDKVDTAALLSLGELKDNERVQFYYASGLVKEIREGSNWTRYAYDESGNRIMEETYTRDGKGNLVWLRTVTTYDSQGRLSMARQFDMRAPFGWAGGEISTVRYSYDAAGNRRRVSVGNFGSQAEVHTSWMQEGYVGRELRLDNSDAFNYAPETTLELSMTMADGSPLPSWLTFNPVTGVSTGTPPTAQTLELRLAARSIDDNSVYIRKISLEILPSERPRLTYSEEQSWRQETYANAAWTFPVATAFMDPEGQALSYTAQLRIGDSFLPLPAGLKIDAATGVMSGTPPLGKYDITVTATDTDGLSVSKNMYLVVDLAYTAANHDEYFTLNLRDIFVSMGGELPVRYAVVSLNQGYVPYWLFMQSADVLHVGYGAPGLSEIVVRVTYADGRTVDGTIKHYVSPPPYEERIAEQSIGSPDKFDLTPTLAIEESDANRDVGSFSSDVPKPGPTFIYASQKLSSFWYDYDAMNRVRVVNGKLHEGEIKLGAIGSFEDDLSYSLQYDDAGREIRRTFLDAGVTKHERTEYNERGQRAYVYRPTVFGETEQLAQIMRYDAVGRLEFRESRYPAGSEYSNTRKNEETFVYDADGRLTEQKTYGYANKRFYPPLYETNERGAWRELSSVTYEYDYSRDGRLSRNIYHHMANEWGTGVTGNSRWNYKYIYTYTYDAREAYLESLVYGVSDNANFTPGSTSSRYDSWGRRVEVNDGKERAFAYDISGNILQRRDADIYFPTVNYAFANGQQVLASSTRNLGTNYVDALSTLTAYRNSESGSSNVTVQAGDTLRSIAGRVYGTEALWYVLASANALDGTESLAAGTTLKVPEVKVNKNDASTFKPYNPGEVIGSTTPSLDYVPPPAKESCSATQVILAIIVVVIIAVVTIYTAGALTGPVASVSGGVFATGTAVLAGTAGVGIGTTLAVAAVAGAVGAYFGQLASLAFDLTDKFDWSAVALGAITTAATAGFGALLSGGAKGAKTVAELKAGHETLTTLNAGFFNANAWAKGAAQAVGSNIVNYGANWAINRIDPSRDRSNEKFNWVNLAADTVSGALGGQLGEWGEKIKNVGILKDTVTSFTVSATRYGVQSLLDDPGAPDYGQMLIDAFGNSLADAAKRALATIEPRRSVKELRRTEEYKNLNAEERRLARSLYRDEYLNLDLKKEGTLEAIIGAVKASKSDNVETRIAATRNLLFASGLNSEQVGTILRIQKDALGIPHTNDSNEVDANKSDPNADKIAAKINLGDVDIQGARSAKGEVLWRPVDKAFIAIGGVAVAVGNFMEEYPWIGAALSTLDVIASPQMALLREAADRFGLLKPIEDATAAISREISERFVNAGYSQENAVAGTAGVVVGIGLIAFGAKAAIKNWTSVYRMVDNVAAKAVQLKGKLTSFIYKTKPSNALSSGVAGRIDVESPENPKFYSVAYQMQLDEVDFNKGPGTHTRRLNESLFKAMERDQRFADQMEELMPGVKENMKMNNMGKVQDGHRSHHAHSSTVDGKYGVMQYAPTTQHKKGSPYWDLMHPGNNSSGGYKELELLYGAPKR
jgi:large repetitive protein